MGNGRSTESGRRCFINNLMLLDASFILLNAMDEKCIPAKTGNTQNELLDFMLATGQVRNRTK